jgi:hypothetical protein
MNDWIELTPKEGWSGFALSKALSDAIWSGLSEAEGQWHYMNLTANSSIWESCRDGSAISMWYAAREGERLEELQVSRGQAFDYLLPIADRFGLVQG